MTYAYLHENKWIELNESFSIGDTEYSENWLLKETPESLAEFGIFFVEDDPQTLLGIRGNREIIDKEGKPVWSYHILSGNEVNQQLSLQIQIEQRITEIFHEGFQPDHKLFKNERLQYRNDRDRTNWLILERESVKAVSCDRGNKREVKIRTISNKIIYVTYAEAVKILEDLFSWAMAITERGWELKDSAQQGRTCDFNVGWPS